MVAKRSTRGSTKSPAAAADKDLIPEFLSKLASALQKRGERAWKEEEVTKALDHAVAGLPDGDLQSALQADLSAAVAQLAELLGIKKTKAKPVKERKPKRAKIDVEPVKKRKQPEEAATLLDESLLEKAEAVLQSKTGKAQKKGTSDLFLSRFPPPQGWIEWHAMKSSKSGDADSPEALLNAVEKALQLCSGLAGQATDPIEALAVFSPAVELLTKASQIVEYDESTDAWRRLVILSARVVVCMQIAAQEASIAGAGNDAGTSADLSSRWWLEWENQPSESDTQDAALEACRAAVAVKAHVHQCARPTTTDKTIDSGLTALIAHDMRLLAPFAAIGQLEVTGKGDFEASSPENSLEALIFIQLYLAAAQQDISGMQHYFLLMLAARKAADVASSNIGDAALAARILASAASIMPPPDVFEWLQEQPPSSVVIAAVAAYDSGPQWLSAHLLQEAPERAVEALAAAARSGGAAGAVRGGQADGAKGPSATDDLLFFVSKEGDGAGAEAGGEEWGEEEEGSDGAGLDMKELPGAGKHGAGEYGDSEDEDGGNSDSDSE